MGFDLYGKKKMEKENYFRNNCWWWRPLATYVLNNCIVSNPEGWSFNDGVEVSEEEAIEIADRLDQLVLSGHTKKYEVDYMKELKEMPLVKCEICNGTGVRNDAYVKGECNGCKGKGETEDYATYYPFSEENVKEFSKFCRESGGFVIC